MLNCTIKSLACQHAHKNNIPPKVTKKQAQGFLDEILVLIFLEPFSFMLLFYL